MVEARIVKIGNSKGVRLPKALLEQAGLGEHVTLEVRQGSIVILPSTAHPREGWGALAKAMHTAGEDLPLWPDDMQDLWAHEA